MNARNVLKVTGEGVTVPTLSSPEAFNALDDAMDRELVDTLEYCGGDLDTKVVIITARDGPSVPAVSSR
ncbi:enoyl-CoA hydratase-related protein [Desulfotomaculum copahuensis]|uniref:Enoyl-CoA hydratase n=1 Tax=Desulfotomaculum copahuensis TaxID=1838280 RepID=A0A1B7LKL9_9FIRM|nr:enoyl-CoA hydratase-related protein [Desulfotomaculum copahuensis]OAT87098.1 hypothetical protein A6M21_02075 [Desulfotomaculum copahuensis]